MSTPLILELNTLTLAPSRYKFKPPKHDSLREPLDGNILAGKIDRYTKQFEFLCSVALYYSILVQILAKARTHFK